MKVGLFWLTEIDYLIENTAIKLKMSNSKLHEFKCFALSGNEYIHKLKLETKLAPFHSINNLIDIFQTSNENNIDFAIISFGRGLPSKTSLLISFLESKRIQNCVWSFRFSDITGKGMLNPPRLPFVDNHFIILNIKCAIDKNFFSRKLINASHYSNAGSINSQLMSMIEYSVGKDELNNHYFSSSSLDQYGHFKKLNPIPYHLCEITGFISVYPELKPSLNKIIKLNLGINKEPLNLFYKKNNGFWYYRFGSIFKTLIKLISIFFIKIENYEAIKNYRK